MGITVNNNPVDPKVARFLSAVLKAQGKTGTKLASRDVERLLDVTRDSKINVDDYRELRRLIKAAWFTQAHFKRCVDYIRAVPPGAARIELVSKRKGGGKLFLVKFGYARRKGKGVYLETMRGGRLKMRFEEITWQGGHPIPIDYKPMYVKTSSLELEGFKFTKVHGKVTLPAAVHRRLNELSLKAKVLSSRLPARRSP